MTQVKQVLRSLGALLMLWAIVMVVLLAAVAAARLVWIAGLAIWGAG